MTNFNPRRFDEYTATFGSAKMFRLWKEFLAQAETLWPELEHKSPEEQRLIFHSWRSSCQVFGMEKFSELCTAAENALLNRRRLRLPALIAACRRCYSLSVPEISARFNDMKV